MPPNGLGRIDRMEIKKSDAGFEHLLEYLRRTRGFDLGGYKPTSLARRILRRMQLIPIESYDDYVDYLEVHPEEFGQLFNTILINVTDFFRDPPSWEVLQAEIIPQILQAKRNGEPIRVWSAGCATGQEAYTLAMVFAEAVGTRAFQDRVKIYATDADEDALAQARTASYSAKEVQSIPANLLEKYFEKNNGRYTFRTELRRGVIFGRHDLVQDAPISRVDLLVCRNALMYFNSEAQARILLRLHFALNDHGFLFLGRAEMLMTRSSLFAPVNFKSRIFSKGNNGSLRDRLLEMAQTNDVDVGNQLARQIRLREAAIDTAPLAELVVDLDGTLVLVNERARSMFSLSLKDVGRPLQDLEISYRPIELRSRLEQAYLDRRLITVNDIARHQPNGDTQYLDLEIIPLQHNGDAMLGAIITFTDVTASHRLQEELRRTAKDLETAYDELQSANEELETTNEELQSANEELETTNEELQSANEELETMNEELQSSNEELHTVNQELRERTQEFNQTNAWLQAVLSIPPTGLVVVDENFHVLLWNQRAEDMWGLRTDEVNSKSLFSLDIGLPVEQLREPIRAVLHQQTAERTLVMDAINRRGRSFKIQVNLSHFGSGDYGKGVALVMEDVTKREQLNSDVRRNHLQVHALLENLPLIILALDEQGHPVYWSPAAERLTGWMAKEIIGNPDYLTLLYPDETYRTQVMQDLVQRGDGNRRLQVDIRGKDGKTWTIVWSDRMRELPVPGWSRWAVGGSMDGSVA